MAATGVVSLSTCVTVVFDIFKTDLIRELCCVPFATLRLWRHAVCQVSDRSVFISTLCNRVMKWDRSIDLVRAVAARSAADFNPIELAFAKLKAFLRAARPRSFDQVVELLAIALHLFTPRECLNFVRHCGYRVTTAL